MWKIPEVDIEKYSLQDGIAVTVELSCGRVHGSHETSLTSGCEFSIGRDLANALSEIRASVSHSILFRVGFAERIKLEQNFYGEVRESKRSREEERLQRIASAPKKPERIFIRTVAFKRNADVVAQKLFEANGVCQHCRNLAPFQRYPNSEPYLEVHHKVPLAQGGDDTLENTVAVCPNCHRFFHYGWGDQIPL